MPGPSTQPSHAGSRPWRGRSCSYALLAEEEVQEWAGRWRRDALSAIGHYAEQEWEQEGESDSPTDLTIATIPCFSDSGRPPHAATTAASP